MATIKKAQLGGLIKKGVKELTPGLKKSLKKSASGPTKINKFSSEAERIAAGKKTFLQKKPYFERNYDRPSYLEREVKVKKPKTDEYGFDIRPDKNGGRVVKKAQTGTKVGGPTYSNLKVKNPTAKDSLRYKSAYDKVMNNQRLNFPSRVEAEGSQEALKKLKDMKSKGVAKSKSGSRIKKAANGTSLGMKSVKAGFDKNPGVTRADIITAAKGKAKSGSSIKKAQNGYQKNKGYEAIKEKELKTIAKTKKTAKTMKSGGKMTKCKYGCK